jgi:hypothetical protein
MSSSVSSISASSVYRPPDFSAYSPKTSGSSSSNCFAIIPKKIFLIENRFGRPSKFATLRHTLRLELRVHPLDLEIMAKRLLSSPVAINLEKLIDPLSKISKKFKEQLNALNSIKNSSAPITLVLEGPDKKLNNSIEDSFLIASLTDVYIIAIRILNRPINELVREVSQIVNRKIQLLLFNTHGLSDSIETYTGMYSSKDVYRKDFEDLESDGGQIILLACKTASDIGHRIAEVSNKIVCAPKEDLSSLHTFIILCPKHHCLEMRTYEYNNNKKTQHAVIFKGNKVSDPCINAELERYVTARQFEYIENFLTDSEDMVTFGLLMEKKGKTRKTKKWYLQAAKLGNPKAMNNLGILLEKEGNNHGAMLCYLKAAKLGNTEAMFNLNFFLEKKPSNNKLSSK